MQKLRYRNILVVAVIVVLAVAIAVIGMAMRPSRTVTDDQVPGAQASDGTASASGASLYLLVTAGNTTYAPILLDREDVLTLTQGEGTVNNIHVTPEGVWMESATCDNQDCVEQGMVTAENKSTRVLGNTIVCLPHRVLLELFTADELIAMGLLAGEGQ